MSRPIPVEIIPSHVHLSHEDHAILFGDIHAGTITHTLSQHGQYAYAEKVEVSGKHKRAISLRVLGPERSKTQVELTPSEADLLGIKAPTVKSGELAEAGICTLRGPKGEVKRAAAIIPQAHIHLSDVEAKELQLSNGDLVRVDITGEHTVELNDVVIRVHPTYRPRLQIHSDFAREHWLTGVLHARIRDTQ